MIELAVFAVEVGMSVAISYSVIRLLKPLLRNVLEDSCGTGQCAEFWGMFSQLMIFIAPLMIVIYFAAEVRTEVNVALEVKDALFRALLGQFLALCGIGRVIWKTITPKGSPHTVVGG